MKAPEVTIIGCGVAGLTTAHCLQDRGFRVRIRARELAPETTSRIPAAMWFPYKAGPWPRVAAWARASRERFRDLAQHPATGIRWMPMIEVVRPPAGSPPPSAPWWADAVDSWRPARSGELPPGTSHGFVLDAPVIETPIYLPWLLERFRSRGGEVVQDRVDDLRAAAGASGVVVNCSGLGARELAPDPAVFASKGQLVLLEPRPLGRVMLDESDPRAVSYVVPRSDAVVLGGTAEDGVDSLAPDDAATEAIRERAVALCPELAGAPVIGTRVGLRPCRSEVRLEAEALGGGAVAVHDYGHGGAGFTLSWGCAEEAAALAAAALA